MTLSYPFILSLSPLLTKYEKMMGKEQQQQNDQEKEEEC